MSRVRRSFRNLEREHYEAKKKGEKGPSELDLLIKAWRKIQDLDWKDKNSFFEIAGYHGMPFRGAGWGNASWWGGYCNHGNILFPTWHRAYVLRLEDALRSVEGCENVAMAYWDETEPDESDSSEYKPKGLPDTFTMPKYTYLSGETVDNPLYCYKFQHKLIDNISPDPAANYSKPWNYQTVRYPMSGLCGPDDIAKTTEHNKYWLDDPDLATYHLNKNIKRWLLDSPDKWKLTGSLEKKFKGCLGAPNYTVFSNTTSARQWNNDQSEHWPWGKDGIPPYDGPVVPTVVPLESPHNGMHLAVGGIDIPAQNGDMVSPVKGANGDMGENDTAAFDPVFFFHHCFIDYVFALWQEAHDQTEEIIVDKEFLHYPGTSSSDSQGPTPGVAGNEWLSLDTNLAPFDKTSRDVQSIKQLGYEYEKGSLNSRVDEVKNDEKNRTTFDGFGMTKDPTPIVEVPIPVKAAVRGSFVLSAWLQKADGDSQLLGLEPVLSRWHVTGCANCQANTRSSVSIPAVGVNAEDLKNGKIEAVIHTHADPTGRNNSLTNRDVRHVINFVPRQ